MIFWRQAYFAWTGLISARRECLLPDLYLPDLEIAPLKNTVISQRSFSLTTTQTLTFGLRASANLSAPHLLRPTLIQQQAKPPCLCCTTGLPGGRVWKSLFFFFLHQSCAWNHCFCRARSCAATHLHQWCAPAQGNSHQHFLEGKGKWLFKTNW